jgi:hypothetical protein
LVLLGGPQRQVAELQGAERPLARPLVGVAVDIEAARGDQHPDAADAEREVADRMRAVAIDDGLQSLAHPARLASRGEEHGEALDVPDPRQRDDGDRDRHQPGLEARNAVLNRGLSRFDARQIGGLSVDRAAALVESDLAWSAAAP